MTFTRKFKNILGSIATAMEDYNRLHTRALLGYYTRR